MSGQPNPLRRKEWQDEGRREQQADERIRELEKKLHAHRVALGNLLSVAENVNVSNIDDGVVRFLWEENIEQADRVLDGERPTGEGEFGALTEEELAVVDNAGDTDA